jgi:small redox-active disulfide protein 2
MKIQVLGSGCVNCKKLHELTQQAVKELNLNEKVEYVADVSKIVEMGVMSSPVLAINNKPVMVGFVPNIEKIKNLITKGVKTVEIRKSECNRKDKCC